MFAFSKNKENVMITNRYNILAFDQGIKQKMTETASMRAVFVSDKRILMWKYKGRS